MWRRDLGEMRRGNNAKGYGKWQALAAVVVAVVVAVAVAVLKLCVC
jgi:hypothetical protein